MKKWKCLKSETAYDSKYFRVKKDLVELPNGQKKEWTYWDSRDSAMVACMTKEKKLVMIRQYRYMVDDEVLEFPAGFNESAETLEQSALREFEEETGYICEKIEKIGAFYETFGQLNRRIHIFFASGFKNSTTEDERKKDDFEDIEVVLVDFEKALSLARKNKIVSMGSSLAIFLLCDKLKEKEAD